ncbi:MAG: aminotransferase class I/II-fold pyridoxal phosphate-dependent enzyme [Planctomycetia bacterium]|nr:aminotransferase class I/II-fold pyridoxal phosphate-dependent enzyme [Planctomycetia bacterium]
MSQHWIADRTQLFDSSGIRKVFDLAAKMTDPINLSIGQPDFDVPEPIKSAAKRSIDAGKNGYAPTQGMAPLREKLQGQVDAKYGHADRKLLVTSGTSGALTLLMYAAVNPGDEVILFDPYFVSYEPLVKLVGGRCVIVDSHPNFQIDVNKVREAITPRTKLILFNSPANPTGVVATEQVTSDLAALAAEKNVLLVSDEIYSRFAFDGEFVSPAKYNPATLVIDGFSKTYGMTGWRVGYVHGPSALVDGMTKLQQYTFVCAPQPFQWAGVEALDFEMQPYIDAYRKKRDYVVEQLSRDYELATPGGAFYAYPKAPRGSGSSFVEEAIANQLLVIPGKIFSQHDTHFRLSYAASDATIERGMEVLRKLAKRST